MQAEAPNPGELFSRLVEIMARLRGPEGCPWDRAQTFDSIKPYTLEETYEVLDAIDARDWPGLTSELGDFLLQAVFYARIAEEEARFGIGDVLTAVTEKLVRRHPHVFGDAQATTPSDVMRHWDAIKQREKAAKDEPAPGLLDGVSRAQPALAEAQQMAAKAARVGFDWPDEAGVMAKIREEIEELAEARRSGRSPEVEEELGDLLFALVNLARFCQVDAEQALRRANAKFRKRFAHVEKGVGKPLAEATIEEMERKWQEAKALR